MKEKNEIQKDTKGSRTVRRSNRNRIFVSTVALFMVMLCVVPMTAFATSGGDVGEELWTEVVNLLVKWVRRIGGAIAFVGAVTLGLGMKSQDAEQKQSGLNTIAAGLIVIGICSIALRFLLV